MGGLISVFEIPLLLSFSYLFGGAELHESADACVKTAFAVDPCRRHCQVGSLAGAARLSNDNAGVLRRAQ